MDLATGRQLPALTLAAPGGVFARALPLTFALLGTTLTLLGTQSFAPPDGRLAELLLHRGWTQPLTLALFFWGLGHALRRLLLQSGERRALEACRTLLWDDGELYRDELIGRLEALRRLQDSLAGQVLAAVFSYFRTQRPTRDEVLKVAHTAVDRAHDHVEDEYKPLGAVMWLLPLSGFLGTVLGMAGAIAAFDQVIAGVGADLGALGPAVVGLATAFDTTLLALALVVPLKLLEVGLEGRDRRLLARIDQHLGAGYVQGLDLAGLAQQTAEQVAAEHAAETVERIERSLQAIDRTLAGVTRTLAELPAPGALLDELVGAARDTRAALPRLEAELGALREQAAAPMTLRREPPK